MARELIGKRVAFLVANVGVEQVELTDPWQAVQEGGGEPVLLAPKMSLIQAMNGPVEKADTFDPDQTVDNVSSVEFDGLILPGGVANPDKLRTVPAAVDLVNSFMRAGKPIASICHGPWMLVEADVVRGKTLTSWPSLKTDIRNAGGTWQDAEVITSDENGWTLVTSRRPGDLPAFNQAAIKAFAG